MTKVHGVGRGCWPSNRAPRSGRGRRGILSCTAYHPGRVEAAVRAPLEWSWRGRLAHDRAAEGTFSNRTSPRRLFYRLPRWSTT